MQGEIEELTEGELSEEIAEKKLSNTVVEFEPTVEWQVKAIGDENNVGDQDDLPFDVYEEKEKMQQWSKLHEKRHPMDQLDEEIEQI
jgi:hypothetical protein